MPNIVINGITVKFPFEPYAVQRDYMSSVIECLNKKQNAMLESPTGTGKTLSLLCATLAWVEHNKVEGKPPPTVIYASRTHSQIGQAMKELKRSEYNHIEATVIGSRDQLCIHPDLKDLPNSDKILECKSLRKRKKCEYYNNFDLLESKKNLPELDEPITDIEDLLIAGVKHACCPYFVAKERAKQTKVIFMPYNYLIDPLMRGATLKDIEMTNSIVILDEAHNVPNVCESSASTSIRSTEIIIALRDMKYIVEKVKEDSFQKFQIERTQASNLKTSLHKLVREINEMQLDNNGTKIHSGDFIYTVFDKAHIAESDTLLIDKMVEILFDNKENMAPQGIGLKAISNFLQIAFTSRASRLRNRIDSYYRVFIENETVAVSESQNDESDQDSNGTRKVVNFWCFSPAFGIENIMGEDIHSLIFTSGTLSPFQPIINEMDIEMPVQLANSHVIAPFQVHAEICRVGVKKVTMDGRHPNRDNEAYIESLGESIVKVAKVVPDGLLIFFKSYTIMEKYQNFWESKGIWKKILQQKPIFIEPQNKKELKPMIQAYNTCINQNNGAIFMAVLRGKVSEGLDFADMYGRGVLIIGIPYGPMEDPKVVLKKECLNRNRTRENKLPSGDEWYRLEAVRAINQAIGRVIRHKNDYGAILLLDDQFSEHQIKKQISKWIKEHLRNQPSYPIPFGAIIDGLQQFFIRVEQSNLPKPEPQPEPEAHLSDDEPDILRRIKAEMIKTEPDELHQLKTEIKIEPMDFDHENDGVFADPQVMLHERKRKTGASSSTTNDAEMSEPQPSTSIAYTDIKSEDTKRKRTDNVDINMNNCDQEESKSEGLFGPFGTCELQ